MINFEIRKDIQEFEEVFCEPFDEVYSRHTKKYFI